MRMAAAESFELLKLSLTAGDCGLTYTGTSTAESTNDVLERQPALRRHVRHVEVWLVILWSLFVLRKLTVYCVIFVVLLYKKRKEPS
jgi:hypothetical protein